MKNVLLIVDSYSWALFNRATALKKHYNNDKFVIKKFNDLDKIDFNNFDIVYSLNWPIHGHIKNKIPKNRKFRLVTSISSHIGWPSKSSFYELLKIYDAVSVSNKLLHSVFRKKYPNLKFYYTPFGVDSELFVPKNNPKKYSNIFGWVGNSSRDVKNFSKINDVMSSIRKDFPIEFITANQASRYSREEMVNFYNKIGTLICFSSSEGTPNPILEAASCGRSIISTNVGNIPELVSGSKYIQIVSSVKELRAAIITNLNNPLFVERDGKFLRKKIESEWSWNLQAKNFQTFLGI